jgi:hypothetical protein
MIFTIMHFIRAEKRQTHFLQCVCKGFVCLGEGHGYAKFFLELRFKPRQGAQPLKNHNRVDVFSWGISPISRLRNLRLRKSFVILCMLWLNPLGNV